MTVGAAAWRARASALAPLAPLAVPLAVLAAGVGVPLAYLVLRAVAADPAALWALVARPRTLRLVGHTLALAGGVLGAATAVAAPLAWISARGGGRWTAVAGVLPLAVPGYVMAYALLGATGPAGLLADVGVALPRASGYAGALAALTLVTFPYLFLNLRAALAGLDPALEDAARALGLRPAEAVWRVVVPQLRPAYLAGALLVVLHVLGDFGVVSLMRFETFSYAIYLQYTAGYDRVYAAALALLLLSLTGIVLGAEAWLLRGVRLARTAPGAARRGARRLSPAGRVAGRVWAAAVALASVGLPLATMTYWLVRGGSGRAAAGDVLAALADSVTGSAPAAVLAALLALPVAWVGVRRRGLGARVVERAAYLGYATPPLAFALAVAVAALALAPWAYQTLGLLVVAYALHFLAEALGPVRSALLQAPPTLDDAARGLGRTRAGAFVSVTLPLVRGGMAASAAFVFLSVMKELPLTFLLAPLGFRTLAMGVWGAAGEALYSVAAPYALVIVGVAAVGVALVLRIERL